MPRVFAALMLPHDVCDTLARDAKAFSRFDPLARFLPGTDLHITLAFLGDVNPQQAHRLSAAIRPLSNLIPRSVSLGRIGVFERQHVLYAEIAPSEALDPVARRVREIIDQMGLPCDRKPFRAHITLARDWRRGVPAMTLPSRTFALSTPVLLESETDPRTRRTRYRQVL